MDAFNAFEQAYTSGPLIEWSQNHVELPVFAASLYLVGVFVVLACRFFIRSFRQRQQVHADLVPPTQQKSTPPAHQSESVERASNLEPRASARYAQRKRKYRHARKHNVAL